MVKRLLLAWAVLAALFSQTAAAPPAGLDAVVELMRFPGVEVTVSRRDCGTVNAFYMPVAGPIFLPTRVLFSDGKEVVLCNELLETLKYQDGIVRVVLAHELAHAVIIQLDLPFTGSSETAADELAAVMLLLHGYKYDIQAAAAHWPWNTPDVAEDPHPSSARRRVMFKCFAEQYEGNYTSDCPVDLPRAARAWLRLLGVTR